VAGDGVDWRALNRANWDDRVPIHLASSFYDLAGFRAGASTLQPFQVSEVGSVAGLSLVHLQCHIGLDTLSWARRGAAVSGLDFSAPAISAASSLDTAPKVEDYPYTYTDGPALSHSRQVEFQHGLGEIVTSLAEAGLRIEFVHELDFELFRRFDSLRRQEDGTYRLPPGQPRVPMTYSLRASAPGPD
jgi:hypothetical protein